MQAAGVQTAYVQAAGVQAARVQAAVLPLPHAPDPASEKTLASLFPKGYYQN